MMLPALSLLVATLPLGPGEANLIPNGDFSQGNVGFRSDLDYVKPSFNCLWPKGYTVAASFNDPLLHRLAAPDPFPASYRLTGRERVFYANAGGPELMTVWEAKVKCQPRTRYEISCNIVSLSGHIVAGSPPHQLATEEWASEFEIWANEQPGAPFKAGQGSYSKIRLIWNSKSADEATIKIVRPYFPHGGGIIGLSDIRMVALQ